MTRSKTPTPEPPIPTGIVGEGTARLLGVGLPPAGLQRELADQRVTDALEALTARDAAEKERIEWVKRCEGAEAECERLRDYLAVARKALGEAVEEIRYADYPDHAKLINWHRIADGGSEPTTTTIQGVKPCVGCGKPVSHAEATVDRYGWWHAACEQAAWDASGYGAMPIVAPFAKAT
jgi:hypothetical protein